MSVFNLSQDQKTFWSKFSLKKKVDLWSTDQIKNFFVPLLDLKANEKIYDIGSGFSPLGNQFIPYIIPNGSIIGFDIDPATVKTANDFAAERHLINHLSFQEGNVYEIDEMNLPLADIVMCQQLLVNVPDAVTAIEHMINLLKLTGRILCVENVNFGAYIYRPDFSWKTNLKISRIWQKLCISGKYNFDHGNTTIGANLPQIFQELKLHDITWQIVSPGINTQPPYSQEFKQAFLENYDQERDRMVDLILHSWGPLTSLKSSQIDFFIEKVITSDYDKFAVTHDLFLTQWYYPFMAIVGWINKREKKNYSENINLQT